MKRAFESSLLSAVLVMGCGSPEPGTPPSRPGWQPSVMVAAAGRVEEDVYNGRYPPVVGLAAGPGSGRITAYWTQYDPAAVAAATFDGTWQDAAVVSMETAGHVSRPSLAFDAAGRGLAAWGRCCPWLPVASRFTRAGGWEEPLAVTAEPTPVWPSRGRGLGWRLDPSVVMHAQGGAFVVWSQGDFAHIGHYPGLPPRTVTAARYLPEVVWEPPTTLSTDYSTRGFRVSGSAADRVFVTWLESAGILAARFAPGEGWTRSLLAPPSPWAPDIGADETGGAVAAWKSDLYADAPFEILARRFEGTSWAPPVLLTTSASGLPRVAVGPGGDAVVLWKDHASGALWARRAPAGGDWLPPEQAGSSVYGSAEAAINARGELLVAWNPPCGGGGSPCAVMASRYEPGSGWAAERILASEAGPSTIVSRPSVLLADDGEGWVAWSRCAVDQVTIMAAQHVPDK